VSLRFTAVAANSLATSDFKNNVEVKFKVKRFVKKTDRPYYATLNFQKVMALA